MITSLCPPSDLYVKSILWPFLLASTLNGCSSVLPLRRPQKPCGIFVTLRARGYILNVAYG